MTVLPLAWLSAGALADPAAPEAQRVVLVLVRSLSYDRSLPGTGPLRLAVAGPVTDPACAEVFHALSELRGVTVGGRPIAPPQALDVSTDWSSGLARVDAVLTCAGVAPAVVGAARVARVPVLAVDGADVGQGAALGVSVAGSRLVLRIDLREAKAQGAAFSAELLEVAVPVGSP